MVAASSKLTSCLDLFNGWTVNRNNVDYLRIQSRMDGRCQLPCRLKAAQDQYVVESIFWKVSRTRARRASCSSMISR
jgi:hypothetical protein